MEEAIVFGCVAKVYYLSLKVVPQKRLVGLTGMCNVSVNTWVKRYKSDGISVLLTKSGCGRKSIIEEEDKDKDAIFSAIKANFQRMQTAKAEWERESGKKVCTNTFKRFLKSLADDNGDETHVCSEGYAPYGWQFPDEEVCILSEKAYKVNCFGFISRQNQCHWQMTTENIDTQFVLEYLEQFSFEIRKITFIVLNNARIHKAKAILERIPFWQKRGLYIVYLPPYCPHLNIAETFWRKLKKEWINQEDYIEKDMLFYAVNRCLANVGETWILISLILIYTNF